eukprot:TRINITY_DN1973_c0_g1::TRINITY_DN1973_c0_g1_i1::g.23032::m.23032 TRINITY_DN1973_c0_g1::TRINITY_DN1973_c0_g1_i1::g.23032  ORF type:complete len:581 (-),score=230.71,EGF_2/PF07974.8/1.1e+04,EGF_2/PF07974.8/0.064 TRINITY_DN1973_c0_g1_i1:469-2136(-)
MNRIISFCMFLVLVSLGLASAGGIKAKESSLAEYCSDSSALTKLETCLEKSGNFPCGCIDTFRDSANNDTCIENLSTILWEVDTNAYYSSDACQYCAKLAADFPLDAYNNFAAECSDFIDMEQKDFFLAPATNYTDSVRKVGALFAANKLVDCNVKNIDSCVELALEAMATAAVVDECYYYIMGGYPPSDFYVYLVELPEHEGRRRILGKDDDDITDIAWPSLDDPSLVYMNGDGEGSGNAGGHGDGEGSSETESESESHNGGHGSGHMDSSVSLTGTWGGHGSGSVDPVMEKFGACLANPATVVQCVQEIYGADAKYVYLPSEYANGFPTSFDWANVLMTIKAFSGCDVEGLTQEALSDSISAAIDDAVDLYFSTCPDGANGEECSGHGDCESDGGYCLCDYGYDGLDCSSDEPVEKVVATFSLAMSLDEFDEDARLEFRQGVAAAVNVEDRNVLITSIQESGSRRRLQASSLEVETTIYADGDVDDLFALVESTNWEKALPGFDVAYEGAEISTDSVEFQYENTQIDAAFGIAPSVMFQAAMALIAAICTFAL